MNSSDTHQVVSKAPATNGVPASSADQSLLQLMAQANGESPSAGPPGLSATPTVSGLVQALRRRWMSAFGLACLAAALAVFAVFQLMPPKYVVSVRIRIAARQAGEDVEFPVYKASMESLLRSPVVINAALNEKLADGRDVRDLDIVLSKGGGAVDWLEKSLKTDFLLGPEVLKVTLSADQPDQAADLLNAIAEAFLRECAGADRAKRQQRLADLKLKKDRIEEDLRVLRLVLENMRNELKVKDNDAIQSEIQHWTQKLITAETFKRANEEEIAKNQAEVTTLQAKLANVHTFKIPQDYLDDAYARDRVIESYQLRMAKIDEEIDQIRQTYAIERQAALMQPLKKEKTEIKYKVEEREREIVPDLEKRYRVKAREELQHQLTITQEKLGINEARGKNLTKDVLDLGVKVKHLNENIKNKPPAIATVEEKIEVATLGLRQAAQKIGEVELEVPGSRISLINRSFAPSDKDTSRQTKVAGAGGFGVFFLVLFGVAMLEFRSRKISLADDLARGLGIKVLGTVPAVPARRRDAPVNSVQEQVWQNQLHESIDAVRTVMLHSARGESLQVLMVTSANTGEGKTTLATQLAASLARAWKRTLIIDGDLRHPNAHRLFDVPQEPGFAEVLRGEVEVADAVRATSLSRLWILPAGNGDAHAIQALAQENVGAIFSELKEQYDFIIVDTPPVLPVTDTLMIGEHVDGALIAVLRDVSRSPAVYAAQQKLAPLGVHTLGAVLLGTELEHSDRSYRYVVAPGK